MASLICLVDEFTCIHKSCPRTPAEPFKEVAMNALQFQGISSLAIITSTPNPTPSNPRDVTTSDTMDHCLSRWTPPPEQLSKWSEWVLDLSAINRSATMFMALQQASQLQQAEGLPHDTIAHYLPPFNLNSNALHPYPRPAASNIRHFLKKKSKNQFKWCYK